MHSVQLTSKQAQNQAKITWRFWGSVMFFIAVVLSVLAIFWTVNQQIHSEENMPVSVLKISGEIRYTQHSEITSVLVDINLSNFFQVDVNQVQEKIAQLPWVYSVSVRKQWPNELKIYVVDQTPIALWNGDFLINKQGEVFQADISQLKKALPQFFGPEGSETIALENYNNFNKLLKFGDLFVEELVLSERFSWQLTLNDGVLLNLGREHRFERVSRFMDLYAQINKNKTENRQVDYVDLRYDTGAAVGWKKIITTKPLAKQLLLPKQWFLQKLDKQQELIINV
ncbi:MAG: cell division protein FtsQ [Gammaproteobacteria bacterium]|nr:MAG: cell division protein FtsQ [Gammaproteobacteria bacterium]